MSRSALKRRRSPTEDFLVTRARRLLATAGLTVALTTVATPALAANPVTPTLTCEFANADGTYTAVFGYTNTAATAQTFVIGGQNTFAPNPADRGQPTVFQPGVHTSVFTVDWSGAGDLAWNLDGGNVHATSSSPRCTSASQLAQQPGNAAGTTAGLVVIAGTAVVLVCRRGTRALGRASR